MKHKAKKISAVTLSAVLAASSFSSIPAYADGETVQISSAEDFAAFSKNCTLDSWSRGKTINLTADISLADTDVSPVPIFCGTFNGNGHTISGLDLDGGNSYQGLFRFVAEDGVINGLTVSGTVSADGAQEYVGGIAGSVRGIVRDCSFEGVIDGTMYVGGIAGITEKTGRIENCRVIGMVQGEKYIGGITGRNDGSISASVNHARINPLAGGLSASLEEEAPADVKDTALDRTESTLENARDTAEVSQDTGGIAGFSNGNILNCTNEGAVGYPHVGYNVGGIVGRTSGYLSGCTNKGKINGRKDVGGIAGQLAPDIQLIFSTDTLDKLDHELSVLSSLADTAMDHTDGNRDVISRRLDAISDYAESASDHTSDLADMTVDWADGNLEVINDLMDRVGDTVDRLNEITSSAEGILDTVGEGVELLEDCVDEAGSALGAGAKGEQELRDMIQKMKDYNAIQKECAAAIREDAKNMLKALAEGDLEGASELAADMEEQAAEYKNAAQGKLETLKQFREAIKDLPAIADKLRGSAGSLEEAMDTLEHVSYDVADTAAEVHRLFQDLSDRDDIQFKSLGDDYKAKGDQVHDSVSAIGDQLDLLNQEVGATGDALSADMRSLKDQLQVISDVLDDAADDARESDKDDLWSDVSEEEIYQTTVGKAEGCINNGVVEGDINAGGVAGAMAVESMLDPEEDIERVGDDSFSFHYETRAILLNCENRVPVTSKKDYAGGIVGRMDLGYILDCRNYGNVESTDGSYVGGIAGSSASTIRRSQSKCMASGKNFVGGIAGDGYNLTENLAFVSIGDGEMYCGAIAGRVDDEGEISSNRFVENGSAGIDGVSYAGKAEPISYESLMAEENAPEEFGKFALTYIADDTLAGRVSCKYGEPLSGLAVPSVPQKPGYHGEWEPVGEDTITFDHVLKAVYTPHVTTVESSARRDDVRAVILAEGTFHEDTELSAEKLSEERDRETWRITLTGDLGGEEESQEAYTYRFILPRDWENASLTIKTAQGTEEAGCKKDQSALVFSTAWTDFELTAEKTGAGAKGGWMIPALAGGALLAAAVLVFLFVKKKKRALPEENGDHQKAVQEAEKDSPLK